jgi:hypothetical protein
MHPVLRDGRRANTRLSHDLKATEPCPWNFETVLNSQEMWTQMKQCVSFIEDKEPEMYVQRLH